MCSGSNFVLCSAITILDTLNLANSPLDNNVREVWERKTWEKKKMMGIFKKYYLLTHVQEERLTL